MTTPCMCGGCDACLRAQGRLRPYVLSDDEDERCEECGEFLEECDCDGEEPDDEEDEWEL